MPDDTNTSPDSSHTAGETVRLDDVLDNSANDADATQEIRSGEKESAQADVQDSPSDTTRFESIGDATVILDDVTKAVNAEDGTRSFPAVVADDDMAPDMTVMLSEQFSELMDKDAADSLQVATSKDSNATHVSDDATVAPGAETEVLPFTRKYFEQYETDEGIPEEALAPQTEDDAPADAAHHGAHSIPVDPRKRRRRIIIAAVIAALVIAAIAGFMAWRAADAHRRAVEPHAVLAKVTAPGYDSADSLIPVHVEGASSEGVVYDEIMFIDINGHGIELPYGDYTLSIAASPLLDTPELYSVPETRTRASITDSLSSGQAYELQDSFNFSIAALTDISDNDIEKSYTYALESGLEKAKADAYKEALVQKRDAELAALKAEQEKQQRITDAQNALTAYAESKGKSGIAYKLVDISGNGLPELLLVGNASSSIGAMAFVCSYDVISHRVVELASAAGGSNHEPAIWYSTGSHQVVLSTTGTNRESYSFYTIGENKIDESHTYVHETSTKTVTTPSAPSSSSSSSSSAPSQQGPSTTTVQVDSYSYDGQEISVDDYNAMLRDLGNSFLAIWAPSE